MNAPFFRFFLFLFLVCIALSCKTQNKSTTQKPLSVSKNKISPSINKVDSTQIITDIKHLASDELEGRRSGEKGNDLAREYIVTRFKKLGLEKVDTSFLQAFSFYKRIYKKKYNCNNIIGKIKGTKHPEKYIVLTAHFDHLGKRDDKIFNGADDNASGVAAMMEAAAFFKKNPPKHSILFVAFDAEELGLEGAKFFVDNPPTSIDNILMNVNLDMISRNKKNEIYICGTHHYPILKEKLAGIDSLSSLNVLFGHDTPDLGYNDWTNASDHGPFHKKKIPFIYLGVEDHEDYHKQTDTFEKIDPSFLYQSTRLVIEILKAFDQ
ncbi:MAG: M20/M25/M40 family metallo-hydrolase [Saprospiraceae bacterium]